LVSSSFDKESGAMYVRLSKEKISRTIMLGKDRFIDVNKSGKMIGIEVLLSKSLPKEVDKIISRSRDVIELLQ
jgi:uncharacterized protein YuzE